MPQLVLFAAAGVAAVAAYKFFRREMGRVANQLAEMHAPRQQPAEVRLVPGPDGIYRPERDGR